MRSSGNFMDLTGSSVQTETHWMEVLQLSAEWASAFCRQWVGSYSVHRADSESVSDPSRPRSCAEAFRHPGTKREAVSRLASAHSQRLLNNPHILRPTQSCLWWSGFISCPRNSVFFSVLSLLSDTSTPWQDDLKMFARLSLKQNPLFSGYPVFLWPSWGGKKGQMI